MSRWLLQTKIKNVAIFNLQCSIKITMKFLRSAKNFFKRVCQMYIQNSTHFVCNLTTRPIGKYSLRKS